MLAWCLNLKNLKPSTLFENKDSIPVGCVPTAEVASILERVGNIPPPSPDVLPPLPDIPYPPKKDTGPGTRKGPGTTDTPPRPLTPVDRMTHACENITLPQLPWRSVINDSRRSPRSPCRMHQKNSNGYFTHLLIEGRLTLSIWIPLPSEVACDLTAG